MSTGQFSLAAAMAVAAAVAMPGASRAQTTTKIAPCVVDEPHTESMAGRAPCFLDDTQVISVRPYYGKATLERAALQVLQGAEVELLPAPGLTPDDLEARVQALVNARQRQPLPVCLVGVGHVHIGSTPLGEASSLTLIAKDPKDAQKVFQRAQLLVKE